MERPTCKTCPYWDSSSMEAEMGWCIRYAPRPLVLPDPCIEGQGVAPNALPRWPETEQSESCGEHPSFNDYLAASRKPSDK